MNYNYQLVFSRFIFRTNRWLLVYFAGSQWNHQYRSVLVYSQIDFKGEQTSQCWPYSTTSHIWINDIY